VTQCGPPAVYSNGVAKIWNTTTFGSKSFAECNPGYYLTGTDWRECQADGTWSGDSNSECKVRDCGAPEKVLAHTEPWKCPDGTTFSKRCTTQCSTGFELVMPSSKDALAFVDNGNVHSECASDGAWTGFLPECRIKHCGRSNDVLMGTEKCPKGAAYGATCNFKCETGYHLSGQNDQTKTTSDRTCLATGEWDNAQATTCDINTCATLTAPENGNILCDSVAYGGSCTFRCDDGYDLVGSSELKSAELRTSKLTCDANGVWSGPPPICKIQVPHDL